MSVKLRLRELRKSRRLTQAQVAEGINCSAATYSRYESGSRHLSIGTLEHLADFYGVSTDYLCGRTPPDSSVLSDYEKEMLAAFRKAPRSVQDDVVDFLNLKLSKKEALR